MGYKMPNVVKTIYLPISRADSSGLTLEEYRNKYGIDLKSFITLDEENHYIVFNTPDNTEIKIVNNDWRENLGIKVFNVLMWTNAAWVEGSSTGYSSFAVDLSNEYEFMFRIEKDSAFSIENVKVYSYEA